MFLGCEKPHTAGKLNYSYLLYFVIKMVVNDKINS